MNDGMIILLGAGRMGGALLQGWIQQGIAPERIVVIEADSKQAAILTEKYHVKAVDDIAKASLSAAPEAIILAVKPQQMTAVLANYAQFVAAGTLFISIAAGKTTGFFQKHLGEKVSIVRSMPNLPSIVGKGATALYASASVTAAQRKIASKLFEAVGIVGWLEDEALVDAVTALSGSGPAYIFLMAESMTKAGEALGLPHALAESLANQTLLGSAELLVQSSEAADVLRKNVTSPSGTTEAALNVLMDKNGLESVIELGMRAAYNRSKELAD